MLQPSPVAEPAPRDLSPAEALRDAPRGEPVVQLHSGGGAGPCYQLEAAVDALAVPFAERRSALDRLEEFLGRHAGRVCAGWLGYDLRDAVEELPCTIAEDLAVPVLWLGAFDRVTAWAASPPPRQLRESGLRADRGVVRAHVSRADYERRVAAVVEAIRAGEIFQANLTQPFTGRFAGEPRELFAQLCAASPAPFAAYVDTGEGVSVLSSSPEELVAMDGDALRTEPIKGTRPRSDDPDRDAALLAELLQSDKDLAELAMIVDLLRNDLGKVAEIGSVRVAEPFPLHASFAQVHHLFGRVTARARRDAGLVDVLRAVLPGGSITGAPKLRCMELLEELEVVRRGVYTGAIGWFGPGRRMHLNVAIRTMTLVGDTVRFNTGGGITADSDPAAEYDETLHKAVGMCRALGAEIETPA